MKPERFDSVAYALMQAVMHGAPADVARELQNGPDIDWQDSAGKTALHYAVERKRPDVLKTLIAAGADIHIRDEKGRAPTPLGLAAQHGLEEEAKILLAAGANPQNDPEENALHLAAEHRHAGMVKLLLGAGFSPDFLPVAGSSPLMLAAARGDTEIMKSLVEAKADAGLQDMRNFTALHWAALAGKAHAIKFLLENGADERMTTIHGLTPAMIAQEKDFAAVLQTLEEAPALRAAAARRRQREAEEQAQKIRAEREEMLRIFKEGAGHPIKIPPHPARFRPRRSL